LVHSTTYAIGNKSALEQLAQYQFPGLAISNAKISIYIFQVKYTEAIFLETAPGKCCGLKLPKSDCSLRTKVTVSFIIIFGTLSPPPAAVHLSVFPLDARVLSINILSTDRINRSS